MTGDRARVTQTRKMTVNASQLTVEDLLRFAAEVKPGTRVRASMSGQHDQRETPMLTLEADV